MCPWVLTDQNLVCPPGLGEPYLANSLAKAQLYRLKRVFIIFCLVKGGYHWLTMVFDLLGGQKVLKISCFFDEDGK